MEFKTQHDAHLSVIAARLGCYATAPASQSYTRHCVCRLQFCFRVVTPNGNTSHFTFGFETAEAAAQWHAALSSVIRQLQLAAGVLPPQPQHAPANILIPDRSDTPLGEPLSAVTTSGPSVMGYPTTPTGAAAAAAAVAAGGGGSSAAGGVAAGGQSAAAAKEQIQKLLGGDSGTRAPRRWIPYKHSNGVAIYQRGNKQGTGEYMVRQKSTWLTNLGVGLLCVQLPTCDHLCTLAGLASTVLHHIQ
jgi:hypothetical protein